MAYPHLTTLTQTIFYSNPLKPNPTHSSILPILTPPLESDFKTSVNTIHRIFNFKKLQLLQSPFPFHFSSKRHNKVKKTEENPKTLFKKLFGPPISLPSLTLVIYTPLHSFSINQHTLHCSILQISIPRVSSFLPPSTMSLRPSDRTDARRNRYKVAVDADEGRRRREDNMVEIRKNRREESLQKKRREGLAANQFPLPVQSASVAEKKVAKCCNFVLLFALGFRVL